MNHERLPVLKPFGERSSAATRKLPAAPLTSMSSFPNCSTTVFTTRLASSFFRTSPCNPIAWAIHMTRVVDAVLALNSRF